MNLKQAIEALDLGKIVYNGNFDITYQKDLNANAYIRTWNGEKKLVDKFFSVDEILDESYSVIETTIVEDGDVVTNEATSDLYNVRVFHYPEYKLFLIFDNNYNVIADKVRYDSFLDLTTIEHDTNMRPIKLIAH